MPEVLFLDELILQALNLAEMPTLKVDFEMLMTDITSMACLQLTVIGCNLTYFATYLHEVEQFSAFSVLSSIHANGHI